MQVRLAHPMAPKGSHLRIHIKYHYTIPGIWGGRTSWGHAQHGDIYDIAQWYPRMCVYDDIRGWDTLPYIGAEFYLEYGHFDYYVTVPWNFIVAGSGELMNRVRRPHQNRDRPPRTGPPLRQDRLHPQAQRDRDPASRPKQSGTLTWHFHMDHTRDVVFSASPTFVWDAARMNVKRDSDLPNQLAPGKIPLAMSVYPVESVGDDAWTKSTEYVKDTVENMSRRWYPYPYPNAISVAGFSTGMEYPGIVFDGITDKGSFLFWVTAHEIGHDWFPMIVGSNERRYAFMDEGFNTFIDIFESDDYDHGKYGPKRDSEYSAGGEPPDTILKVLDNPNAPPILTRADAFPGDLGHPVQYFKGAYGNVLLREQILGPERFDYAFRKYIRDWAYQTSRPFRFLPRHGERRRRRPRLLLARLVHEQLDPRPRRRHAPSTSTATQSKGVDVTVANLRPLVLPTTLQVTYKDGTHDRIRIPVEAWLTKGSANFTFHGDKPVTTVILDPDHVLPDDDRTNNTFTMP